MRKTRPDDFRPEVGKVEATSRFLVRICSCMLWSVAMAEVKSKEDKCQEAGKVGMILSVLVEVVTKALLSPQAELQYRNECLLV